MTDAQTLLQIHLSELGLPTVSEYRFLSDRRFRFDLANVKRKLAFECCGGHWTGGHRRAGAITLDYAKMNLATANKWRCYWFTNEQILSGQAREFMRNVLEAK